MINPQKRRAYRQGQHTGYGKDPAEQKENL